MLDRTEIYPYQRITDKKTGKVKKTKQGGSKKPNLKNFVLILAACLNVEKINRLTTLLTLENLILGIITVLMARAFILGELLPFIFALVVSFGYGYSQRSIVMTIFAVLGFVTVLEGGALWSNIITLLILTGIIHYIKIPEEKTWWALPILTCAVILIAKSTFLFIDEMNFYQEMIIVFEAMISGILTFVFMVCSGLLKKDKSIFAFNFEEMSALIILGIGLMLGLTGINVGELSLSSIFCRLGILIAAFIWGSGGGTMVGVMAGTIPSIASSVFAQSLGMYAVSGLLAGLFRSFGRLGVIIGFMLGNLALAMFINQTELTILGMWETGIACLIFFLLPEYFQERMFFQSFGAIRHLKNHESQGLNLQIREKAQNRIYYLAQVFEDLSASFAENQEMQTRPGQMAYINYLYEELSEGFCKNCPRHDRCWDRDCYSTSQELLDIFTITENEGHIEYEECSEEFKKKCLHGRELVNAVNYLFDRIRMNEYWSEKIEESRKIVSHQLQGLSRVIENLAEEIDLKANIDFELKEGLQQHCRNMGFKIKDITPIRIHENQMYIDVLGSACVKSNNCESIIAPAISSYMGEKFEVVHKNCPVLAGKGLCEFTLERAFNYKVISGTAQVARETICGDNFKTVSIKGGKSIFAISDGMGVGEKAAEESEIAIRMLEKLLNSGFDKELVLNTINSVLLLRSKNESFTTIDICMIDLFTAEIDFIKTAGAASFIKRGKQVEVVSASSLPLGILEHTDVFCEKRSLYPHDMIIMVSDGVIEASRKESGEAWIVELLFEIDTDDPQFMAQTIINNALGLAKGTPQDDMTVICMCIDLN